MNTSRCLLMIALLTGGCSAQVGDRVDPDSQEVRLRERAQALGFDSEAARFDGEHLWIEGDIMLGPEHLGPIPVDPQELQRWLGVPLDEIADLSEHEQAEQTGMAGDETIAKGRFYDPLQYKIMNTGTGRLDVCYWLDTASSGSGFSSDWRDTFDDVADMINDVDSRIGIAIRAGSSSSVCPSQHYRVRVHRPSQWPSNQSSSACAAAPFPYEVEYMGFRWRVPGEEILINGSAPGGCRLSNMKRGTSGHELLHTLGFAHSDTLIRNGEHRTLPSYPISGTLTLTDDSILRSITPHPSELTADDEASIHRVYP